MMTYRYIILHAFISFLVEMSLTVYATQFLKIYNFTQMHLDCYSDIFPSSTHVLGLSLSEMLFFSNMFCFYVQFYSVIGL